MNLNLLDRRESISFNQFASLAHLESVGTVLTLTDCDVVYLWYTILYLHKSKSFCCERCNCSEVGNTHQTLALSEYVGY
jgi:hypothetical protein